jgi:hypothetical protein
MIDILKAINKFRNENIIPNRERIMKETNPNQLDEWICKLITDEEPKLKYLLVDNEEENIKSESYILEEIEEDFTELIEINSKWVEKENIHIIKKLVYPQYSKDERLCTDLVKVIREKGLLNEYLSNLLLIYLKDESIYVEKNDLRIFPYNTKEIHKTKACLITIISRNSTLNKISNIIVNNLKSGLYPTVKDNEMTYNRLSEEGFIPVKQDEYFCWFGDAMKNIMY